ncbi:MAG: hypothetical protein HQL89_14920 [Magnetococcales bacterium]|nr:hypothetical protein [Magnetococcales bacterium]
MMKSTPTLSRLIAVVILLIVVKLFWSVLVIPYWNRFNDQQEQIDNKLVLLNNYKQVSDQTEKLEKIYLELRESSKQDLQIFDEDSASVVASKLQAIIKILIFANKSTQKSSQIIRLEDENGFQRIGVKIQMITDLASMRNIIDGLERYPKLLVVDMIDIQNQDEYNKNYKDADSNLNVTIDIYAFVRYYLS